MRIRRRGNKIAASSACLRQMTSASVKPTSSSIISTSWFTLESRIMFDGAAVATAGTVGNEQLAQQQADASFEDAEVTTADRTPAAPTGEPQFTSSDQALFEALAAYDTAATRQEIVFVSSAVRDYQQLLDGISPNVDVMVLDANRDGVEQIAAALEARTGLDAIHIISHGASGMLNIGGTALTTDSIGGEHANDLAIIKRALGADADILIYGCDVSAGEVGQAFVSALSAATRADVAASTDTTGHATLGGDWVLEHQVGQVDTTLVVSALAQSEFESILAPEPTTLDFSGTPTAAPTNNVVLETVGNSWRYANVAAGVDAIVRISNVTGTVALVNIDDPTQGRDSAFQPVITTSAANSSIEFTFEFVGAGTNTPATLNSLVATGVDVDGQETAQWFGADSFTREGSLATPTQLTVTGTLPNPMFTGAAGSFSGIDLEQTVANYSVFYAGSSSSVRMNLGSAIVQTGRQYSVSFEAADIQAYNSPVAVPDLASTTQGAPVTFSVVDNDWGGEQVTSGAPRQQTPLNNTTVDLDPGTAGVQTARTVAGEGTYVSNNNGTITFTPVAGFVGDTTPINYTVNNSITASNPAVETSNEAPIQVSVARDTDGDTIVDAIDIDDDNDGMVDATEFQGVSLNVVSSLAAGTHADQSGTGLRVSDSTGQYFVDIYRHTSSSAGATNTFNSTSGLIESSSTVENTEFIQLVYTTSLSPVPWQLSRVTINDIDSLTDGSGPTQVRDGYVWSEPGTWTPLGTGGPSSAGAVVSVDTVTADDVGVFVRNDPDGDNDLADIGQFTTVTAQDLTLSDVLVNMEGSNNDHDVQFDTNQPVTTMSLFVFNSGGGGMIWSFLPQMTVQVPVDTDGDTIPNHLDLDSDNDGISDLSESTGGAGDALADTNNDGIVSLAEAVVAGATGDGDLDNDGLMDIFDADTAGIAGSVGNTPINTDATDVADYLDLDSDNDDIADTVEARLTAGYVANDGNVTNDDADGDGVIDLFDTSIGFGGTFTAPVNTDTAVNNNADTAPDYRDTDSDGDGLLDAAERGTITTAPTYADPDGSVNNPSVNLADLMGSSAEVDYREVNHQPLIDLNSTASTADTARNHSVTYTENAAAVNVAAAAADINDSGDLDITNLNIAVAGVVNGANEVITIGGTAFPQNASSTQTVTIGGTTFSVAFTPGAGFVITKSGGGAMAQADMDTLVRGITYVNTSGTPTAGDRTLTFTMSDGITAISPASVATVTVALVNDPPVLTGDLTATVNEGATYVLTAADLGFTDVDDVAAGVTFSVSGLINGTVLVNGVPATTFTGTQLTAGQVSFQHNGSETTSASFLVNVEDGNEDGSAPVNSTFNFTVTPVNDPPVGVNDTIPVMVNTPVTQNVLGNDTDAEGNPLTIAVASIDTDGDGTADALTLGTPTAITDNLGNSIGSITVNANGTVTFTPALNYTGPVPNLTYTLTDGTANGSPATVSFGSITFPPILAMSGELKQIQDAQSGFGVWREEPKRVDPERVVGERQYPWIYDSQTRQKWPHIGGFYVPAMSDDPDGVWSYDMTSGVWSYPMDRGLHNMERQHGKLSADEVQQDGTSRAEGPLRVVSVQVGEASSVDAASTVVEGDEV